MELTCHCLSSASNMAQQPAAAGPKLNGSQTIMDLTADDDNEDDMDKGIPDLVVRCSVAAVLSLR